MHSISAGSFTARTARSSRSPSTIVASGASIPSSIGIDGDIPSTAITLASASPPMPDTPATTLRGFHVSPLRLSVGMSDGMPSSHVVASRCTWRVASTSVHIGAHAVTTIRQIGRCPTT